MCAPPWRPTVLYSVSSRKHTLGKAGTAVGQEGHRFVRLECPLVSLNGNRLWLLRDGGLQIAPTATEHEVAAALETRDATPWDAAAGSPRSACAFARLGVHVCAAREGAGELVVDVAVVGLADPQRLLQHVRVTQVAVRVGEVLEGDGDFVVTCPVGAAPS